MFQVLVWRRREGGGRGGKCITALPPGGQTSKRLLTGFCVSRWDRG